MSQTEPQEIEVLVPEHGPITFYGDGLEAVVTSGRLTITRNGSETLATIRDWVYWRFVTPAADSTN